MSFTYTVDLIDVSSKNIRGGIFTNTAGSTGGAIVTGLKSVSHFTATPSVTTTTIKASSSAGTTTIITGADEVGTWEAKGI